MSKAKANHGRMFLFLSVRLVAIALCMIGIASIASWLFERGLTHAVNRVCSEVETLQCTLFP